MTKRSLVPVFAFGCLALLCLADSSPVSAQRGQRSGGARSAPSAGRSAGGGFSGSSGMSHSAPSRSAPSHTAPSRSSPSRFAPSFSAPSRSSPSPFASAPSSSRPSFTTYQRGSTAQRPSSPPPAPAPAPRSNPTPPRYDPPSAPRYQPPETPRYQPPATPRSQPDAPRYQPPAEQPRYQPPSTPGNQPDSPRYVPPDNSGRVYDGGRRTSEPATSAPRGPADGRNSVPASPEPNRYEPRTDSAPRDNGAVPSTEGWNNLGFERRTPRTPIPVLSGSSGRGPGAQRSGLSARRAAAGQAPAVGEGLVRMQPAPVTREAILERYRSSSNPEGRSSSNPEGRSPSNPEGRSPSSRDGNAVPGQRRSDANGAGELSRARTSGTSNLGAVPEATKSSRSAAAPKRGSVEAARRERESVDDFDKMRAAHPERARAFDDAGTAVARATNVAAEVAIGASVSFGTGCWGGWFWQPCNTTCNQGSWYWNGCNGWPIWCSSSCGFGWPYGWGFSWWGHGWGFSYSSYCYSPWSYGYCSPYWGGYASYPSYDYWSPAPSYYSTVIYQGYGSDDQADAAGYQDSRPVDAGEATVAVPQQQGSVPQVAGRGVSQYLSLGDEAFSQGRYSDAVHNYARAVEASPNEGVLYLILSDALFATGDYHYAAFALRRSLELDPTLLDSVVDKHGFYGDPTEFDRQITLAENYIDEHYLDDDARLVLAANYLFANRPAQSQDLLLSAFSKSVRESSTGALLLKRAEELRKEHPLAK